MNSTPQGDPLAKAQQFVRDALVWDNHACMPLRPEDQSFLPQLERVKASGVDVISLNIGMDLNPLDEHLRNIASFRSWVRKRPADYQLVQTIEDIDRAKAEGKTVESVAQRSADQNTQQRGTCEQQLRTHCRDHRLKHPRLH